MVDSCFTVGIFCICTSVLGIILKQYCSEQSMLLTICACSGISVSAVTFLIPIINELTEIFTTAEISSDYINLIFKGTAISFITRLTSDICKDCGNSALASTAELWGRCSLTFLSLPLLKTITALIVRYVEI